tara:strand:+ start:322 stop:717 length:396 start_codon:yes stop_codon:yes gene_type:complete
MATTSESKTKEIYTEVHDREQFLDFLKQNPGIMIFKFGADWCKPCQSIKDDVEQHFANTPDNVLCFDLDIDDSFDLYAFLKSKKMVTGIPSILAYIKGNETFVSDFAYSYSGGKDALNVFFNTVNIKAGNL